MNIIEEIRAFREIVLGKQDKLIPGDHIILGDDDVISVDFAPVDALLDRLEEVEDDINALNFDVTELDIRLDAAEENIEDAQDHLDSVDYSINELNESLDALKTKVDNIHGFEIVALSEGQYDPETMKPTVENPKTNTLYLVPNDDPTQRNLWIEWLWISNRWEQFGTAVIDLSEYVKKTDTPTAILPGVVKVNKLNGVQLLSNGQLAITPANLGDIQSGQNEYLPIAPAQQHNAVFYGLARASRTPALYYNAVDKTNIRLMIDAGSHAQVENLANDVEGFGIKVDQLLNRTGETRPGMVWESKLNGAGWSEAAQGKVVDVTKDGVSLMDEYGIVELPDVDVPTKTSDLVNDSGFITESALPTKVSDLENDSGFLVSADLVNYALRSEIPTKVSDLQNDSGFLTEVPLATDSYVGGVKVSSIFWTGLSNGTLYAVEKTYNQYQANANNAFISKGTLENVLTGRGYLTEVPIASTNVVGGIKTSPTYGTENGISGILHAKNVTYSQYSDLANGAFISKGTLENVLTGRGYPVDVKINGTSIVDENKVANIPIAYEKLGLVFVRSDTQTGIQITGDGKLATKLATNTDITNRNPYSNRPIAPPNFDYAVKAALTDGIGPAYTATEQAAARARLGITAGEKEIFEATYGVTTHDEIAEAVEDGKTVVMKYNAYIYSLSVLSTAIATFNSLDAGKMRYAYIQPGETSVWHSGTDALQFDNLSQTIEGRETSTTNYPTTKAVVDYTDNRFLGAGINNVEEVELLNGTFSFHAETEEEGLDEDGNPKWYLTDAITDITRNDIIWGQQYKLVVDGVEYRLYGEQHSSNYNAGTSWHDCKSIGDSNVLGYIRESGCNYIIAYRFKDDTNINIYTTDHSSSHVIKLYKVNTEYEELPNELCGKKQGICILPAKNGGYSIALGNSANATSDGSLAEGIVTLASGQASHAEGNKTIASGEVSHAEGRLSIASGQASHAEGGFTGSGATAKGNVASGYSSHAEGAATTASGDASHAEGLNTTSSGTCSHAEGNYPIASGAASHAEGQRSQAIAHMSHAEGNYTIVTSTGIFGHAEGNYTVSNGRAQHVQGQYNIEDESDIDITYGANARKYLHIVGNGTADNARSNAHTLDWNGLGWFKGGLKVGGTGQDDPNAENVVLESDLSSYALEADLEALEDKVDALHGFEIVFLTTGEYDPTTGIPTILGPQEGTLYLVPSGQASPDVWTEWLWTGEAWEKFGSSSIDLSNYVQKTDYANTTYPGIVKMSNTYQTETDEIGNIRAKTLTYAQYSELRHTYAFVSNGTLNNVLAGRGYPVDVQIDGTSIVDENKVANIPIPTKVDDANRYLIVKYNTGYGLKTRADGLLTIVRATTNNIDDRNSDYRPIVPSNLDYAVKAALTDGVGPAYTETEQAAARTRLGIQVPSISYDETEEMLVWQTTADDGNEVSY